MSTVSYLVPFGTQIINNFNNLIIFKQNEYLNCFTDSADSYIPVSPLDGASGNVGKLGNFLFKIW